MYDTFLIIYITWDEIITLSEANYNLIFSWYVQTHIEWVPDDPARAHHLTTIHFTKFWKTNAGTDIFGFAVS